MPTLGTTGLRPGNTLKPPPTPGVGGNLMGDLENIVPGLKDLLGKGAGVIGNQLTGTESPAIAQNMNAMWGAGAGLAPGSEFLRNRGVDLFGQRSEARQQAGLQGLLGLLGGVAGPAAAFRGQDIERELGLGNLNFNIGESAKDEELRRALAEQNLLNTYLGFLR